MGQSMKVVILAGGFGTRISEESHLRPKSMIEIGGFPILWHIMKYYAAFGHNEFIICCGYKSHFIKQYFAEFYLYHSDVTFDFTDGNNMTVHNNIAEPWKVTLIDTGENTQTGGRIKRIRPYVGDGAFMMTYGDGVSDIDLSALVTQHKAGGRLATLSAVQPGGRFGVMDLDETQNRIVGFREKAREDSNWINAGFMILGQDVFDYIDGDATVFEREPMERLSADGELGVYRHSGFWQCMDTQRDKWKLDELWKAGNAPWKVWGDSRE